MQVRTRMIEMVSNGQATLEVWWHLGEFFSCSGLDMGASLRRLRQYGPFWVYVHLCTLNSGFSKTFWFSLYVCRAWGWGLCQKQLWECVCHGWESICIVDSFFKCLVSCFHQSLIPFLFVVSYTAVGVFVLGRMFKEAWGDEARKKQKEFNNFIEVIDVPFVLIQCLLQIVCMRSCKIFSTSLFRLFINSWNGGKGLQGQKPEDILLIKTPGKIYES